MQRALIVAAVVLLVIGVAWPWLARLPLGRLPGDLRFERDGFAFFFPLATGLRVSVPVSVILWWVRK
jgi:hypothetical protein